MHTRALLLLAAHVLLLLLLLLVLLQATMGTQRILQVTCSFPTHSCSVACTLPSSQTMRKL